MGRGRGTRGRGDSGTQGRGDSGTRGLGDAETRGRGDSGTRGRGDSGTRGLGDSGTWGRVGCVDVVTRTRAGTRGLDKQATPDVCSEFVKYNFWQLSVK